MSNLAQFLIWLMALFFIDYVPHRGNTCVKFRQRTVKAEGFTVQMFTNGRNRETITLTRTKFTRVARHRVVQLHSGYALHLQSVKCLYETGRQQLQG